MAGPQVHGRVCGPMVMAKARAAKKKMEERTGTGFVFAGMDLFQEFFKNITL
jgi:hypothetical protein